MHVCVPKLTQWLTNLPSSQMQKSGVLNFLATYSIALGTDILDTVIINFYQLGNQCLLSTGMSQ